MPIDPSIALAGVTPKFNNPFDVLAHYRAQREESQLRQQQIATGNALEASRRQDIEKQRREEAAQQQFFNIISTSKTPDEVESRIKTEAPGLLAGYQKQRMELDDKAADIKKKQLDAQKLKADVDKAGQEYSAPFMQLVEKSGYKPEVFDFALNTISSHFEGFPADQLRQQAAGDPTKIKQLIDGLKSTAQQNADTTATTAGAELSGKTAQSSMLSAQAAGMQGGLTPDQQRQQAQAEAANAVAQQNARTSAGQLGVAQQREGREQKQYDATYGSLQPGAAGPDNANANPLAKAIAEYRSPPVSSRSMAGGPGKALMEEVMRLNPSYDGTQFPTRQKTRIAFTSGPQSQTLNSLNTAISHLDQFVDVAKALDNGSFQPGNQAFNWLKTTFGSSAPTNFEGIKQIMSGELASAFKKSGATDQEIAGVERAIASKNSTGQLIDYATKIAMPALGSKASTFGEQYHQVMGEKDPWSPVYPEAKRVLDKYGATHQSAASSEMKIRKVGDPSKVATGPRGPVPAGWEEVK